MRAFVGRTPASAPRFAALFPRSNTPSFPVSKGEALMRARRSPFPHGITVQAAALLVVLLAGPVFGGTTGTLAGRVVDEKNQPVVGANIRLEGMRLGAMSDDKGQFVIVGVSAGSYTVHADLMGHSPFLAQSVTIVPDFT